MWSQQRCDYKDTTKLDEFLSTVSLAEATEKKSAFKESLKIIADYDEQIFELITDVEELDNAVNESMNYWTKAECFWHISDHTVGLKVTNTSINVILMQLLFFFFFLL